jgi:hypothetical protein
MGVLNVLGPNFIQIDASIVRQFVVRERQHLEFRFEMFNLPNNVRFNAPAVSLATPTTFGQIRSAQDPRILQLAMKYVF